ncbi:uncharacterized protein LOC109858677 [Pseudomyrmex gracilis]|uniref:uncharacterized protein LOC109858677 n=1 Tax=Pseudomyrmex gracilis TaxID=219809 RepID=UPI00099505A1|nr:uncharacterized protein LOC109858677 [Pseudomyrmex gracilis]
MDFAGNRYYNIHRVLLSSVGLWPYQNPKMKKFQRVIYSVVLVSSIVVQLISFFTTEYSMELLLKILSFAIPCMVFVLKYISFIMNNESMRALLEYIVSDWNLVRTEVEFEIIKKHSDFGRFYTLLFTCAVYSSLSGYVVIQFMPDFLDVVAPRNESRSHNIPLVAEYFVDQQKYYLPILLHIDFIALIGLTVVMSTESLSSAYIQHAIGMFEIASYRIEHAFDETLDATKPSKFCLYCANIISAVIIHRRAMNFCKFLMSNLSVSYIFLVAFGVASLTANLLRLVLVSQSGYVNNLEEVFVAAIFVLGHVYYIFLGNYTGQRLIDHSTDVFHRIYMSHWYAAPPHAQKLLLFMMRQSVKGTFLSVGGLFVPSLEGFATLCALITSAHNLEVILKILPHIMPVLIYTVQYNAHHVYARKVKLMMDEIRNDWNALNDKQEIEIIERYAQSVNMLTFVFALCTFFFLLIFIFIEFLPMLLDVVAPLNESRPREIHVVAEYFIDPVKYFPFMLLHEIVACSGGAVTTLATGTILMVFAYHVCGMMKVVSLLSFISLNLFRLLQPATIKNTTDLITNIVLLIGHFAYMFLANYFAQTVTDHSADIFDATCKVMWYVAPLSSQKILLFFMRRTIKFLKLVLGDMFVASLEGFATVICAQEQLCKLLKK